MDAQDTTFPSRPSSAQQQHSKDDDGKTNALQTLSPERTNRQPMLPPPTPGSIPSSPAPSIGSPHKSHLFQDPFLSTRRGSDVQGKVAQFNNLALSMPQQRKEMEKALERARLGREQAEGENDVLRERVEEFEDREKRVGLRLEETMEENDKLRSDLRRFREKYERAKDALSHSKDRFREELRRMKGAEFKADSNQLAAQQALQSERQLIKSLELELKYSREKNEKIEKESLTSQIKLIEMDEQLARFQQQMKLVEQERDTLRTTLKEEEVARIAAEGRIPLPISADKDEFSSPRKRRESHIPTPVKRRQSRPVLGDPFESENNKHEEQLASIKRQLEIERLSRKSAEDLIHFMNLECQLQRCSCRLAEDKQISFLCDEQLEDIIGEMRDDYEFAQHSKHVEGKPFEQPQKPINLIDVEDEIEFSPETGTFRTVKSPKKDLTSPMVTTPGVPVAIDLPSLAPASLNTSPSLLALSEPTEISRKVTSDACQVLPSLPDNATRIVPPVEDNVLDKDSPATPKTDRPRASDADLLSFTPFAIQNLTSQQPQTSQAESREMQKASQRHAPVSNSAPAPARETYYQLVNRTQPEQHESERQQPRIASQHSSSFPQPQHDTRQLPDSLQPPVRSGSSNSHRSRPPPTSKPSYTIQTITTTTTIPLAAEPATPTTRTMPGQLPNSRSAPAGLAYSPGTTKSREEALACIRSWREGNAAMANRDANAKISNGASAASNHVKQRSRSVVISGTPGRARQDAGGRDVSAPVRF